MKNVIASSAVALSSLVLTGLAGVATGQVVNPSFEFGVPYGIGPLQTNQWGYDGCAFVPAEFGITPNTGQRMLKALATNGNSAGGLVCDVFQIIDLTSPADQAIITAGGASGLTSVLANRVSSAAPANIDTRFDINIRSHTSLANAQVLTQTGIASGTVLTDNNQATWESVSASLLLPASTQYVTIHLAFVENIIDDNITGAEFRGNYMDDATFSLVPAPGALALAGLGGVAILRRRRATR